MSSTPQDVLEQYVQKPDQTFTYAIQSERDLEGAKVYHVKLTSQTWRGHPWQHWLSVIVPDTIQHKDKALMLVAGGSNEDDRPDTDSRYADILVSFAVKTGSICAAIEQVPNQPLYDGRYEDALIAYTFDRYIETGDAEWPLLLPMVKSVVKGMDAVVAVADEKAAVTLREFLVTGASKRGWTTWLTGAVDDRAGAIAPMVIDVLNMPAQTRHQLKSYGGFSQQIGDYTKLDIQKRFDTPQGKDLLQIVDPYSYRDRLTLPKYILLGTNDPYWCVDSANLYYPALADEKHIYYDSNAGHGLSDDAVQALLGFYRTFLDDGATMPEADWFRKDDGTLVVKWRGGRVRPVVWSAYSETRDFRDAEWLPAELSPRDHQLEVRVKPEEEGWSAYYVELRFKGPDGQVVSLCTQMTVLPETFPEFPDAPQENREQAADSRDSDPAES